LVVDLDPLVESSNTKWEDNPEDLVRILADAIDIASMAFTIRYPDGRLGQMNEAFVALTGYSKEELGAIRSADITPLEWQENEKRF
jgi:PAS domain-containing protein